MGKYIDEEFKYCKNCFKQLEFIEYHVTKICSECYPYTFNKRLKKHLLIQPNIFKRIYKKIFS